ncbi:MAG: HAD-IIA family hydrolase [Desulfurococcales archaeon]|nr:HAD-IIA family hydrolase [Desulfurococcales archaeon]
MKCYKAAIVDLDGVVWRSSKIIEENVEALKSILETTQLVFLTNNSTRTRKEYALKLSRILEYEISPGQIITSGYSAAEWLRRTKPGSKTLVVGEEGLVAELTMAGHTVLTTDNWMSADAVVVGLDRNLTYRKLAAAHKAIVNGALFVATNRDTSYPDVEGTVPGAGSIVSLLETSSGKSPVVDAGKPNKWILELALAKISFPRNEVIVIGDRIDTDIAMAQENKLDSILVLTGVTRDPPRGLDGVVVAKTLASLLFDSKLCIESRLFND